jgi:hypothetical protein
MAAAVMEHRMTRFTIKLPAVLLAGLLAWPVAAFASFGLETKFTIDQTTPGTTNGVQVNNLQTPGQQVKSASTSTVPASDQGWTPMVYGALTGLSTTDVKATAGFVGKVHCYNPNATVAYVQVFNVVHGSVTLGTTVPTDIVAIAPSTTDGWIADYGAGVNLGGSGISVAATTTYGGLTAPGSALVCSVWVK